MKCPVDDSPMIVVERKKIELDYCPECKGIWFDSGELELLPEALGIDVQLPELSSFPKISTSEKPRKSPRTRKKMDKINMGSDDHPIVIDRDPLGLGLWFDMGELTEVFERFMNSAEDSGKNQIIRFLGETIKH